MEIDLKRMRYFCAVVEHGQISRAAQALHMAQPPLSQRLRELEAAVGAPLLRRQGREQVPTPAGQVFYEHARRILAAVQNSRDAVLRATLDLDEPLRIGLSTTGRALWIGRYPAIQAELGSRRLGVVLADSTYLEQILRRGDIDLALMQPPLQTEGLSLELLQTSPLVAVSKGIDWPPGTHALALESLAPHPLLLVRRSVGMGIYELVLGKMRQRGLSAQVPAYCSDASLLLALLGQMTRAVALVPEHEAQARPPDCACLPLAEDFPPYRLCLVQRATDYDSPAAQALRRVWAAPACAISATAPASTAATSSAGATGAAAGAHARPGG